jgi:hypothetical protein
MPPPGTGALRAALPSCAARRAQRNEMPNIVVITGAGAGVGRAVATQFARNGFDMAILSRDPERLERAATELRAFNVTLTCLLVDSHETGCFHQGSRSLRPHFSINAYAYPQFRVRTWSRAKGNEEKRQDENLTIGRQDSLPVGLEPKTYEKVPAGRRRFPRRMPPAGRTGRKGILTEQMGRSPTFICEAR